MTATVCSRLGITYPILQGPMAWASDSTLVAAVSNAGGLGILGIGSVPVDVARAEVRKTKELTHRPFGFNLYAFLPNGEAMADMLIEEGVPVVETGTFPGLYDQLAQCISRLKAAGIAIITKASSVDEAVVYERVGTDFISIKGADGGGHIFGFTGTFSLLPQVVDAVSVPVICGGGVTDGRGIAASLMLGAKAVEIGSRFLLAHECPVHENYKQAVVDAKEGATVLTGVICNDAVRQLPNSLSERLQTVERECTPEEAVRRIQEMATDSLRKAAVDGDIDEGCVTVGQAVGMLHKRQSAQEIIEELVMECGAVLNTAASAGADWAQYAAGPTESQIAPAGHGDNDVKGAPHRGEAAVEVVSWKDGELRAREDRVAVEEPLELYVDGVLSVVTMRTPGREKELAAGYCFSEALIDSWRDIGLISYCGEEQGNRVDVTLEPERKAAKGVVVDREVRLPTPVAGSAGET